MSASGPGRRLLADESGFTLAEALVAMTMMTTVLFSLYAVFDTTVRVFELAGDELEAVENARLGLGRMEREIRAAYPQAGGVLLSTWEPTRIAFQNKPTDDPRRRSSTACAVVLPPISGATDSAWRVPWTGPTASGSRTARARPIVRRRSARRAISRWCALR